MDPDELDLRPYLRALTRNWRYIAAATIAGAVIAFAVAQFLPKEYTASASVMLNIRQTGTQIGVNTQALMIETIDINARRQSLIGLAKSTAVLTTLDTHVVEEIFGRAPNPNSISGHIKIKNEGDFVTIIASSSSPRLAKTLADAWRRAYLDAVTTLFKEDFTQVQSIGEPIEPIEPSSPKIVPITALGALSGLLLAIVYTLVSMIRRKSGLAEQQLSSHERTVAASPASHSSA